MALDATTVFEVRFGGSDTNGGGFVPGSGGTDWTLQDSAQYSVTDGVTAGTTTITSATAAFGTDVVGNIIYVSGGTGSITAGWYQIMSRTNSTTIVVDRSTGLTAGTGVTLKIGGALASPGKASALVQSSGSIYIKYNASPYVITSATYNIPAGCCQPPDACFISGYDTTRSPYVVQPNRPTIQTQAALGAHTMFQNLNAAYLLQNLILDANSNTSSSCVATSGECFYAKAMNFKQAGFRFNTPTLVCILCEATGGNGATYGISSHSAYWCSSYDNTSISLGAIGTFYAYGCIAYNNVSTDGFAGFSGGGVLVNCVSYNNVRGYYFGNAVYNPTITINCIAEANSSYGYYVNTGLGQLLNCADYNNVSGRKNTASLFRVDSGPINGSGSFFVSAGTDFRLNNTAGAGASARAVGFPTTLPQLSLSNYLDLGALQHQDTGGGSSGPIAQFKTFGRGSPY